MRASKFNKNEGLFSEKFHLPNISSFYFPIIKHFSKFENTQRMRGELNEILHSENGSKIFYACLNLGGINEF